MELNGFSFKVYAGLNQILILIIIIILFFLNYDNGNFINKFLNKLKFTTYDLLF